MQRAQGGGHVVPYASHTQYTKSSSKERSRNPQWVAEVKNVPSGRGRNVVNKGIASSNNGRTVGEILEMLSSSMLSAASPETQKQILGKRLFPLVNQIKVYQLLLTLEMDNIVLVFLLESPEALAKKVEEVVQVLVKVSKPKVSSTSSQESSQPSILSAGVELTETKSRKS